jgi:acetyl esterase/lipase
MPSLQSRIVRLYLNYLKATTDWNDPPEKLRQATDAGARLVAFPKSVQSNRVAVEHITAEWLIPPQPTSGAVILYLHGGGYATGSIKSHRAFVARIAAAGKLRALLIEYRLAPEHPFPAALQDSLCAYDWLRDNNYERIIIVGDSAGGGLALSTLISLRDQHKPMPVGLVCISPLVDLEGTGESLISNARRDPWLTVEAESILRHYIGDHDPRDPLISPLYADLSGLPPMLIHVGQDEIMLSDSTRLAEKAKQAGVAVEITKQAGVAVEIKIWSGMWHVFPYFAPFVPEASQAIAEIGAFIHHHTS